MSADRDGAQSTVLAHPSGPGALKFRIGTHRAFLRQMQQRTQQRALKLPDGTAMNNVLQALNPQEEDAFVPALLSAWATVCDVLSFYQERIANEGYLATATEPLSLRELAHSIGYRPAPALSATTHLAFTMIDAEGAPTQLLVPKRTAVQSVPLPGEMPVTFETDEDIEVRPDWNGMAPILRRMTVASQVVGGAKQLIAAGLFPTLRPGMPLLLHGKTTATNSDVPLVRALTRVESNPTERTTLLGWEQELEGTTGHALMEAPEALVFAQSAKLFGANAPDWARQPETAKAQLTTRIGDVAMAPGLGEDWTSIGAGLPPGEVIALKIADDGMIAAAIGNQVITRGPGDGGWKAAADLPQRSQPTALALASNGQIYLGTQRGELLSSTDRGATWFKLVSPAAVGAKAAAQLPAVPIRTLSVATGKRGETKIVAGTALGIWSSAPNGSGWTPWNAGLPDYDPKTGGATAAVNDIAFDSTRDRWVVATDQGLFYANGFGGYWYAAAPRSAGIAVALRMSRPSQWIRAHLRLPAKLALASGAASATAASSAPAPGASAPSPSDGQSEPSLAGPAQALAILSSEARGVTVFAGTKQGVWKSGDGGRSWRPTAAQPGGTNEAVSQLAAGDNGLLAGTGKGLFRSADAGDSWTPASGPFAAQPIAALAAAARMRVAAAPFGGYPGAEWPNFETVGRQIDLDRSYETLVPNCWIVLAQANSATRFAAARVVTAATVLRRDFLLNDRVTRVTLDRDLPHPFNPRTATVFLSSRALDAVNPTRHHVDVLGWDRHVPNGSADAPLSISLAGPVQGLKDRLISISGQRVGARCNGSAGGVRKWDGSRWIKVGAFDSDGWALLVRRDGTILLGTNNGVQRLDGDRWVDLGELRQQVNVLAELGDGEILAGTEHGLWRCKGETWTSSGLRNRCVLALLCENGGGVVAGTDRGLNISTDGGGTWMAATGKVAALTVTALARTRSGHLIAGTDRDGLLAATAEDWTHATPALRGQAVHALALNAKGHLYAATAAGIFRSDDGVNWPTGGVGRVDQGDVWALAFDPHSDELYFAQRGAGVSTKGNVLWAGLANDIRSLVFDHEGSLLASSLSSTVLLGADGTQSALEPQFVADVSGDDLARRLAKGRLAGDLRHIFLENKITLPEQAEVDVLTPESKWRISDGKTHYLLHALGSQSVRVFVEGVLEVMAWPMPIPKRPDLILWRVRNKENVVASLRALTPVSAAGDPLFERGEIVFTGAAATNESVAEIHQIGEATIAGDRSRTDVSLSEPLQNVYDAATVTCNANVAPASHGETPALYEVIGSGDASVPNQSFTLNRKPITALPAAAGSWEYAIVVRVRGSFESEPLMLNEQLVPEVTEQEAVEWHRVETLTLSGPNDLHYVLQEDEDNAITLMFGDGKHGKRLPTGTENVIALYRTGSGPTGNVEAARLTQLRKRPAGVRKVTNPTRASGGTVGEIDASIRQAAPIAVRTLGRIVSPRDYHDFVRAWPGIAKVAVRSLSLPKLGLSKDNRRLIHITLADVSDRARAVGDSQQQPGNDHGDLLRAMVGCRTTDCAVLLDRYLPRWFRLEADFVASPQRSWKAVSAAVSSRLLERYGFQQRNLGEPVTAADVTAVIQDVPGVQALHLKLLYPIDWKPALLATLDAGEAYWDEAAQAVHPAELLLVGGESNIVLGEIKP